MMTCGGVGQHDVVTDGAVGAGHGQDPGAHHHHTARLHAQVLGLDGGHLHRALNLNQQRVLISQFW